MDDEAYVERLFAILTNPHPTGIRPGDPYGQADDGIDRYDGFGSDVRVESLDLVHGEHGAEVEVAYRVAPPPQPVWRDLPRRGTLRLPVDAEWRELSGYEDPAAYAPWVAHRVMVTAGKEAERHRERFAAAPAGKDGPAPSLPTREKQWEILVGILAAYGPAREVRPGEIDVQDPDGPLTVIVTPDQWEQVLVGEGDDPGWYVDELLGPRADDETFLVFYDGALCRSTRAKLPPVRSTLEQRRIAELRADPDRQVAWFAYPPDRPPPAAGRGALD